MKPGLRAWSAGALGGLGAVVGGLAYATMYPQSQIFGPVLVAPRRPGEIALTFDDGPNPTATPELLEVLADAGVRATFFLIGRYVLREPALVRRMVGEGHVVGAHTMTHPKLPLCRRERIVAEISGSQAAIEDAAGVPVRLFRPPHGARTPFALRMVAELSMTTVQWNCIGNDWTELTAEGIAGRVEGRIRRNGRRGEASNVVLHDGGQDSPTADRRRSVAATRLLLERYRRGDFVTLDGWVAGSL